MTIQNAIKKLEKNGFKVTSWPHRKDIFTARKEGLRHYINFYQNGDSDNIYVIDLRTEGYEDDIMTDYHAGTFCDSITQAIRRAVNW